MKEIIITICFWSTVLIGSSYLFYTTEGVGGSKYNEREKAHKEKVVFVSDRQKECEEKGGDYFFVKEIGKETWDSCRINKKLELN